MRKIYKNLKNTIIWNIVKVSIPVRDGLLLFLDMPVQNIWTALLVIGIMIWAYKKPNEK